MTGPNAPTQSDDMLSRASILVVDDDRPLAEELCEFLQCQGLDAETRSDVTGALARTAERDFDIALLDLWLGRESGLDLLKAWRRTSKMPVILMTAQDTITENIIGLSVEADDYLFKPLNPAALMDSVRALLALRNTKPRTQGTGSVPAKRFLGDQRGAISVLAALSMMMLLAIAAIVIDTGMLYSARRNLQAVNDAAALAAVQNPTNAATVAGAVFAANGYASPTLTVTTGVYTPDESLSAEARFAAGSSNVNAVRVRASFQHAAYFAGVFGLSSTATLVTQSTAARLPTASFGVGTRVADLNAGLINALMGQVWGSSLSLSLIDYQALLGTNLDALTFLNKLATDVGVSGSYQNLANVSVTSGQILNAIVETLNTSGAGSGNTSGSALALQSLQSNLRNGSSFPLSTLIDLTPLLSRTIGDISPANGFSSSLNIMNLLAADARVLGNGQLINVGASITVPVVNSSVTTHISVGSPFAQTAIGKIGTTLQTAQIRVAITETIASINLGGIITAAVQLPLYLEVAPGQATLAAMPCTKNGTLVQISATSGLTNLKFGAVTDAALNNFAAPVTPTTAPVVNITLLTIPVQFNISGSTNIGSAGPTTLNFSQADINAGTTKSISALGTPFSSLSTNFTLAANVNNGLINALLNTILGALNPLVASLIAPLDAPVNQILNTLGLMLGTADVQVFNANCRTPTLVG